MARLLDANPPPIPFPDDQSLCEHCGYPLRGLAGDGDCPECGQAIAASDPVAHRPGLPWQRRTSIRAFFATWWLVLTRPRRAFRMMRLDQGAWRDRKFLLLTVLVATVVWALTGWGFLREFPGLPWSRFFLILRSLVILVATMIVASYVEALGVAFFSRRRGWRMGLRRAEQVACYAAIGWMLAPLLHELWWRTFLHFVVLRHAWRRLAELPGGRWIGLAVVLGMAALAFEWFVFLGMRQVRYGNSLGRKTESEDVEPATDAPTRPI